MDHSTLNWVDDCSYDELECEHVNEFVIEYEYFLMDDEPKCDVFDINDACFVDFIAEVASTYDTSTDSLDLKPLLDFWKYAILGHDESLIVIIASNLNHYQEEILLNLLVENKDALGWTLRDIKGISPIVVQYRIHLEDSARHYRDRKRSLNSCLQKVVRKEVLEW